jgi:hypothetical protein
MRQPYLVEEFRYSAEANGQVVERRVREPVIHVVASPDTLIERTRKFFELQMSNAPSPSALPFDGVRIVRESDGEVVFRATVREFWDGAQRPSPASAARK